MANEHSITITEQQEQRVMQFVNTSHVSNELLSAIKIDPETRPRHPHSAKFRAATQDKT